MDAEPSSRKPRHGTAGSTSSSTMSVSAVAATVQRTWPKKPPSIEIMNVNVKGAWLTIKAAIQALREARGAIVNVSSLASLAGANMIAYELSKAAINRLTLSVAMSNAKHGVRCNAILPGLMDTPMAIATVSEVTGVDADALRAKRNAQVPLNAKMGDAWDTAYAALFLASDEAKFITGALLPVDGGMSARVG